jgi:quercetin dioxygenase-like cupin family protein
MTRLDTWTWLPGASSSTIASACESEPAEERWLDMPMTTGVAPSLLLATTAATNGGPPKVSPLMSKALLDRPGMELLAITVEYPPGGADPVHRHDAHGFIYVLEGSIVMQVEGGEPVTLTPGQTFYEGPDDLHVVGRNASTSKPARFLVVFLKHQGAPVLVPVE